MVEATVVTATGGQGLWGGAWRRLKRSRAALVAAALLLLVCVMALVGPWFSA